MVAGSSTILPPKVLSNPSKIFSNANFFVPRLPTDNKLFASFVDVLKFAFMK